MNASLQRRIAETIGRFGASPASGRQAVLNGMVLPLPQELGWDVFDTTAVVPDFALGRHRVDLALCGAPLARPHCVVELEGRWREGNAVTEVLPRARRAGVPLLLVTDGPTWRLFFAEDGEDAEPIFALDLRTDGDTAEVLDRFLSSGRVVSGASVKEAVMRRAIPRAWQRLVSRADGQLVELLRDEVWDSAGVRPDAGDVRCFLAEVAPGARASIPASGSGTRRRTHRRGTVTIEGREHDFANMKDALVVVLRDLHARDETFLERCAAHPVFAGRERGDRTRRYIARNPEALYPHRPDLREHATEFVDGWWLATNSNNATKERQMRVAAEVGGLGFGTDLVLTPRPA